MQNLTHKLARSILTSNGIAAVRQLQAAADEARRMGYPGAAAAIREIAEAAEEIVTTGSGALKNCTHTPKPADHPAMAAGVTTKLRSMTDMVRVIEEREAARSAQFGDRLVG
jgi:hypothetical protein